MNTKQPTWRDRFNEQFQESEMEDGWGNYSYVICTDKANLKNFIQSELSQQRKEIVEWIKQLVGKHNARILNEFQKQGTADMPLIAYDERVCLIPAIALAMKETDDDIITKLSSEEV